MQLGSCYSNTYTFQTTIKSYTLIMNHYKPQYVQKRINSVTIGL